MTTIFILMVLILIFVKSPFGKGLIGESLVNLAIAFRLNKNEYQLFKNVTIPTKDGTTQIDHIIVSKYGIFVIETKNMKGWIFGDKNQKTWTQKIYKYTNKFQNPLHQNYKHVKTLESLLNINKDKIFSVITFVGDSTFKTEMPDNVTYTGGFINFINSKKVKLFSEQEIMNINSLIDTKRLSQKFKTNLKHVQNLKNIVPAF
ncbi:MAG: NERD domain-containing protein [Sulfurimonas sp.]|nr:NERD domain-containing protein [Sulfurimonas sp.]